MVYKQTVDPLGSRFWPRRLELSAPQTDLPNTYTLLVTWEQPGISPSNEVRLAGLRTVGVERETGFVALLARPPLQVQTSDSVEGLMRMDPAEAPSWTTFNEPGSGGVLVAAYRYLRPGFQLSIQTRKFAEATLLQALVDQGQLTSAVADDGQTMTEMRLAVRNNGLQHLRLELPSNSILWSAFVDGQPVRPARDGERLLLPLDRTMAEERPLIVELTYIAGEPFPRTKGFVRLFSPRLDLPLKNIRLNLYLPPRFRYSRFRGSMEHELASAREVKSYSQSDYSLQEEVQKQKRRSKLQGFLSKARSQLAGGQVKRATEDLNQALALKAGEDRADASEEFEKLAQDISRAQSSNLVEAQHNYTLDNSLRYGAASTSDPAKPSRRLAREQAAAQPPGASYNAASAEAQWRALQRAHTVNLTRLQPLRVNLPKHGLHHAFTQLLQTEPGQPLSIHFTARSQRATNWPKILLGWTAGVVLLWILADQLLRRRRASQTSP